MHSQQPNDRASDGRQSDNAVAHRGEVVFPPVAAWVEQIDPGAGVWIDPSKIGSFEQVTLLATPRQILGGIRPAMLPGADRIEMECRKREMPFLNAAVLATEARLPPNLLPGCLVHHPAGDAFRRSRALAWRTATKFPKRT
jgi:hypothetical protein